MVHLDLVAGLTQKEISIDYIRDKTCADGIITTRTNLIRHAKERGLATVLRYFVLDSMALDNIQKLSQQGYASQPDVIEILPGTLVPKVVKRICAMSRVPVVAGGLIQDREDVMNMLDNGVIAISTSWYTTNHIRHISIAANTGDFSTSLCCLIFWLFIKSYSFLIILSICSARPPENSSRRPA